jgi:NAD-dependent SIR2 family protein deacetylase
MRAKCSKCKNVFETPLTISLVHIGPLRLMKCPACGKTSMINTFVSDPITWPAPEKAVVELPLTEEELKKKRLEESKYEESQH